MSESVSPPFPCHRGCHGWRRASSGASTAVLGVGVGSWGSVGHVGTVCLAGASLPACFGRPESTAPPRVLFMSLTSGAWLSVRERENSEILLISEF